jgi:hypothetical protein
MKYAPIIIFGFNRLDSIKRLIASLQNNAESKDSDLFVFIDGPRINKPTDKASVESVRSYIATLSGFASIEYEFSDINRGLGSSIIHGVTKVIQRYGKAIILEDDLILSPNFLSFVNQALDKYESDKEVFSVCGYSNRVKRPKGYNFDSYFCTRSSSWGWATWSDRWSSIDWNLKNWDKYIKEAKAFNKWGGSDCWQMLVDWHDGRNKSWAIRFCFAQFLQDKVSVFPLTSKVRNEGFDGGGTNCKKWSRFKYDFDGSDNKLFSFPTDTTINKTLYKSAKKYHSIRMRILSRIMYLIYR